MQFPSVSRFSQSVREKTVPRPFLSLFGRVCGPFHTWIDSQNADSWLHDHERVMKSDPSVIRCHGRLCESHHNAVTRGAKAERTCRSRRQVGLNIHATVTTVGRSATCSSQELRESDHAAEPHEIRVRSARAHDERTHCPLGSPPRGSYGGDGAARPCGARRGGARVLRRRRRNHHHPGARRASPAAAALAACLGRVARGNHGRKVDCGDLCRPSLGGGRGRDLRGHVERRRRDRRGREPGARRLRGNRHRRRGRGSDSHPYGVASPLRNRHRRDRDHRGGPACRLRPRAVRARVLAGDGVRCVHLPDREQQPRVRVAQGPVRRGADGPGVPRAAGLRDLHPGRLRRRAPVSGQRVQREPDRGNRGRHPGRVGATHRTPLHADDPRQRHPRGTRRMDRRVGCQRRPRVLQWPPIRCWRATGNCAPPR